MPRLALAIAAALALHVLLLMIVVPEPQVSEPEVKGSGHVTVSFVRSSQPVEPPDVEAQAVVENLIEETEQTKVIEVVEEPQPELLEKIQIHEEALPKEVVTEKISTPSSEVPKTVPDIIEKPEMEAAEKKVSTQPQESFSFASEVETLRDPQPISNLNKPPQYPSLARKRGWEGTVILEVDVDHKGMVRDIVIQNSSTYAILDKEALRAVRKWQFQPGSKTGKFIDMKVLIPVQFVLKTP